MGVRGLKQGLVEKNFRYGICKFGKIFGVLMLIERDFKKKR